MARKRRWKDRPAPKLKIRKGSRLFTPKPSLARLKKVVRKIKVQGRIVAIRNTGSSGGIKRDRRGRFTFS
jgi:hypothetical protein